MSKWKSTGPKPTFPVRTVLSVLTQLVLLLVQLAYGPSVQAANRSTRQQQSTEAQTVTTLELGKPIERELAGGQRYGYQITLAEGQYAFVVVEQRGIDLAVALHGTDGKLIASFDFGSQGKETIGFVAETAGSYRLIVNGKNPKLPSGRYEIRWVEVRNATEKDRLLHESSKLRTESARLSDAGSYTEALPLAEKTLELRERLLGTESPYLVHNISSLAFINFRTANYEKAEELYLRGLMIAEKGLGPEDPQVARFLSNLADIYSLKGDDARAVPLYERALSILEKHFGPEHPQITHPLHQLGMTYRNMGDFLRAEPLFQRSLVVAEKTLGEDHPAVASSLGHLASFYREKGDFDKAEPLYQRALTISEKTRGPNHPDVAARLNNLANLYSDKGDYEKAELLYRRALSIEETVLGPNHPEVACTRGNLAFVQYSRGDYAKAEPLYLSSLAIREKALGPNHPMVGLNLNNLASLYFALKDYAKAEPLYHRALSIYETAYGSNYYELAKILVDLAKMSAVQGKLAQAVGFQTQANAIIEHNLNLNLVAGSERQKLAYLATLPEQVNQAVSLHLRFAVDDGAARELAATTVLQRKGRLQDALSNGLASLRDRSGADDQALLDQLNTITSQLAQIVLNEPHCQSQAEHQKQVKTLEEQREKLEGEISSRSAGFYQHSQLVTLAAIRSAIPDEAALIEFAVYRPFEWKTDPAVYGEPHYAVYVIRNQGEVRWAELGPAKVVDAALAAWRQALRDPLRGDVQQLARTVDEKVMQRVRTLAGDATQLLISPDGELNLIPFGALIDEQGRYLIKQYSFTYLTSGRDLLRIRVAREAKSKPLVIANPSFGEPPPDLLARTNWATRLPGRSMRRRSVTTGRDLAEVYFASLSGTAQEAQSIQKIFDADLLTGVRATESAVKQLSAPRILHIATHGFFLAGPGAIAPGSVAQVTTRGINTRSPRPADRGRQAGSPVGMVPAGGSPNANTQTTTGGISANAKIDNPLLRSGLALAGANVRGGSTDDDGIMTALEASGLNLWGTKLVVLSACDTGLGEVHNGEGVYGLRRAFVLAGAESLVMSLWPISDYSTRTLMTSYYKNLKEGMGRGAALRTVQLDMIKRHPKLHPFYWANFIQSGEWANLDGKR